MSRLKLNVPYLNEDNPFLALKVLGKFVSAHPRARTSLALAARIHSSRGSNCEAPEVHAIRIELGYHYTDRNSTTGDDYADHWGHCICNVGPTLAS